MAANGSEDPVEVANSADATSPSGKGLEQYAVEETNDEGVGETAVTVGEANNAAGETNLNEDKQGDASSQNPQEGKVFVGGISWQTTEETLQYYFQRFGEVGDVVLMRDKITGNPRGFGFVRFTDPSVAERVLQEQHSIDGRHIDVKIAVPRDGSRGGGGAARQGGMGGGAGGGRGGAGGGGGQGQDSYKIFVGGLDQSVTDPEFRSYFEQFGVVTDSVVMYDKKTSRSRGFGFITFADSASMLDALRSSHSLNGKPVEVKEASPREYHSAGGMGARGGPGGRDIQRGGSGVPGGYGMGGYPGGGYGYGGFGGPPGGYSTPGGYSGAYSSGYDGGVYGGGGYGGGDWGGMQGAWGGWQGGWGGGGYGGDGSGQSGSPAPQGDQPGGGYGGGSHGGQVPSDYSRQGGGQGGYGSQGPARAQHNRADRSYRPY